MAMRYERGPLDDLGRTRTTRRAVLMGGLGVAGAAAFGSGAKAGGSGPALWRAGTVTLFGQMPLPKSVHWFDARVSAAFAAAQALWTENPDIDPKTVPALPNIEPEPGYSIYSDLSPADRERLARLLEAAGQERDVLDGLSPGLVRGRLAGMSDQMSSGGGEIYVPEAEFKRRGRERRLPMDAEWTAESIVTFVASLTRSDQIDLVRMAIDDLERAQNPEPQLESWLSGDLAILTQVDEQRHRLSPAVYKKLVTDRNAAWVPRIQKMLAGGAPTFICVGIGHLIGPVSIVEQLRASGVPYERI